MMIASRSDGYSRYSHTNSKRSMFHSLTRVGDLRRRTISCWRGRRFSASSRARRVSGERKANNSWVRNATIGRFITIRHPRVIPDEIFGRHSPQTNGIVERFHKTVLNEFYRVAFRRKIYAAIEQLQATSTPGC